MRHGGSITETWDDVLIRVLQEIQKESIIDVRFGYADVETHKKEEMDEFLLRWGKMRNDKNGQHCHDQHNFFLVFPLS